MEEGSETMAFATRAQVLQAAVLLSFALSIVCIAAASEPGFLRGAATLQQVLGVADAAGRAVGWPFGHGSGRRQWWPP